MKFSLRNDLGLQLLALYLLFVGPIVMAAIVFDRVAAQRLEADVKAADLALARAIAQETNTFMDSALLAVRQLATYPEVIQSDPAGMETLFRTLSNVRSDINLIYRLDSQGTMVYHYPPAPGNTVGWDFSMRDYFQRALTTHNPIISQGRKSPTTQQLVTTAVMPLWSDEGQFLGVVATNIKLQSLSHTLASIANEYSTEEGLSVAIVDSAGYVVAHPQPPFLLSNLGARLPQVFQALQSRQSGSLIAANEAGQDILYSYVPIPSGEWGVIVSRPTSAAFATRRALHEGVLLLIAVFLVVGLFFWLALSRQIIRPVERLAVFSQTVGLDEEVSGEQEQALDQLARRPDQIGHLIRSMHRMEEVIDARLKELSTLLETSAAVVSTLDSQAVLDRILEQVERLMGIQKCAIVAMDEPRGIFRAQASRGLSPRYAEHISIDPGEPASVTLRALRSRQPIQVSDTEEDPSVIDMRPRARSEGYRSILCVPLLAPHAPPSALLVYKPVPHVFSQREINLLTSFANHAAMAIENANLFARSDMLLKEQTRRLEALIQSLQDGLILEDLQGRILYANRRISELVDLPTEELVGQTNQRVIERILLMAARKSSDEKDQTRLAIEAALSRQGSRQVEIVLRDARRTRYLRLQVFDVTDSAGTPMGRGLILRDITKNREIDQMKSSLISTVSHELRTPLAAIKGYATTLLAEDVDWDLAAQREFLTIISNESDRLSDLVNDLLDMSRIESGSLTVSRSLCNLEEIIPRAARRAHPCPNERLQVHLPQDLPPLFADPPRIEAVLRNLIENAVKYAGEQSPVIVSAEVQGPNLVVRVEDEGPGIAPEESLRIFDSFYRVENGLNRRAAGAGVGLAICQGFVRAHGGDIWLEPRDKGACFAFSLPLNVEESGPDSNDHALEKPAGASSA